MLNYAGSYHDVSFTPAREVPAWVTLDAALHYDLGGLGGYLKGTRALLTVTNLLDARPPFVNTFYGYDPANASLVGRTIGMQLTHDW